MATDRFLVLGDNHGNADALRRVVADTEGERFDFAVHVGDLTNARREGKEKALEQLRESEPHLKALDDRARHGLLWVYGNRDCYGDFEYDLEVGTRIPREGYVEVGGQRFTASPKNVDSDVVLVTHLEEWALLDHFEGRAHFCGNNHRGRYLGRRLNSAFLYYEHPETGQETYGGYFVVEVGEDPPFDVEMRRIGSLVRIECETHRERGVQFQAANRGCMYCTEPPTLSRELSASALYGVTRGTDRETATDEEVIERAMSLWEDPPEGFRERLRQYLSDLDDRYALIERDGEGYLTWSEYGYPSVPGADEVADPG